MRSFATTMLALVVPSVAGGNITSTMPNHRSQSDCLACHAQQFQAETSHFIESNQDCIFCHEVDEDGRTVRTFSTDETCEACHVTIGASVAGSAHEHLGCVTCHNPHSSAYPNLFRIAETSLCGRDCHGDHDIGLSHPTGETVTDPRLKRPMSCVSTCHSMHKPTEPQMLQMAALDLCFECHEDKF